MAYNRANGQPTTKILFTKNLFRKNVIIDGRNFYDNPIESDIEKYRELKKSNDWKRRRLYYRIFVGF